MEIITGYVGKAHVKAEQDRDINQGIIGPGSYVLKTGMQLAAEVSSNNEIKIRDGVLMHQGCAASIKKNTYDSLTIINGSQGMKRIDLIIARYEKDQNNGTESLELKVIQGTPAEANAEVPSYTEGDIQAGDYVADMPLYKVIIDGLNITEVKKVFEIVGSNKDLVDRLKPVNITDQFSVTVGANCPLSCILESVIQCGNVIQMNGIFTKNKQGWISGSSDVSMKILHKTEPDKYKPLSYRNPVILGALNDSKNTDLHLNYLNSGYFYGVSRVDSSSTVMQHSWQITYIMAG